MGAKPVVVVTGGAGYIGSHTVRELAGRGFRPVVLDDLSEGHRAAAGPGTPLEVLDLADDAAVALAFRKHAPVEAVLHFAASCSVPESVAKPDLYYRNNVVNSVNLLGACRDAGVKAFIFSSTAATFGNPLEPLITEKHPQSPINPYGETKLVIERALPAYETAFGLRHVALRYFNAAGAHPAGDLGEDHEPENHLIPLVLRAATGAAAAVTVFGTDYPTPDGTCVRDYIHVCDLATAHVLALERLLQGGASASFNLGNGLGYSVRDVIREAERVTGKKIPAKEGPRRPGDPATLVASSEKIARELGWKPRFGELKDIIGTAWRWHQSHPAGYGDRKGVHGHGTSSGKAPR